MDGKLERSGDRYELIFERQIAHPPEKVWRVLTERNLIVQWFPCDIVGEWKVGETLQFVFQPGQHEGLTEEELRGEVLTVEPCQLLEFTWGKYHYRCELAADGDGCRFRFTESQSDPSEGARSAAGWEMCFENLELILQGAEVVAFVWETWQSKFESYVKTFEPEFGSQQGAPDDASG